MNGKDFQLQTQDWTWGFMLPLLNSTKLGNDGGQDKRKGTSAARDVGDLVELEGGGKKCEW